MTIFIKAEAIGASGPNMKLWDFTRLENGKIRIGDRIGGPLGFQDGSQVYSAMFRYEHNGSSGYEIVLSTFGPENYRQICSATFYMLDVPGSCAEAAKFLADRNIDILNSVSISMVSGVTMVWKMLVDLSYFGDAAQLKEDFDTLKRQRSSAVSKIDAMEIDASNISDRYTKGIVPKGSPVKVKALKKAQKGASIIRHGEMDVPADFLKNLENVKDGALVMMVADTDEWAMSLSFMEPNTRLAEFSISIPDKPGAVHAVTSVLAKSNINLLCLYTKVLVYYDRMSLEILADTTGYEGNVSMLMRSLADKLAELSGEYQLTAMREIKV
jgi:predicted amino acid-binding ACT domain protein